MPTLQKARVADGTAAVRLRRSAEDDQRDLADEGPQVESEIGHPPTGGNNRTQFGDNKDDIVAIDLFDNDGSRRRDPATHPMEHKEAMRKQIFSGTDTETGPSSLRRRRTTRVVRDHQMGDNRREIQVSDMIRAFEAQESRLRRRDKDRAKERRCVQTEVSCHTVENRSEYDDELHVERVRVALSERHGPPHGTEVAKCPGVTSESDEQETQCQELVAAYVKIPEPLGQLLGRHSPGFLQGHEPKGNFTRRCRCHPGPRSSRQCRQQAYDKRRSKGTRISPKEMEGPDEIFGSVMCEFCEIRKQASAIGDCDICGRLFCHQGQNPCGYRRNFRGRIFQRNWACEGLPDPYDDPRTHAEFFAFSTSRVPWNPDAAVGEGFNGRKP